MMWWSDGGGWGWAGAISMTLTMLIVLGGLILFGVWAARLMFGGPGADRPDPKTILEERFARGEINKEELEEGRRALDGRG